MKQTHSVMFDNIALKIDRRILLSVVINVLWVHVYFITKTSGALCSPDDIIPIQKEHQYMYIPIAVVNTTALLI